MGAMTALAAISVGASLVGAAKSSRDKKRAEASAAISRDRMYGEGGTMNQYMTADISNPFAGMENRFADLSNPYENLENRYTGMANQFEGMENTMEDLTVNQQQAEFERDMFTQSQANTLGALRGAAGGSGIAALAQQMAQSGTLASQRAAASIGAQESVNQRLQAGEASRLQQLQAGEASRIDQLQRGTQGQLDQMAAAGDWAQQTTAAQGAANLDQLKGRGQMWSQEQNLNRLATQLGMNQSETAAYMQQAQSAQNAQAQAITGLASNAMSFATGLAGPGLPTTTPTTTLPTNPGFNVGMPQPMTLGSLQPTPYTVPNYGGGTTPITLGMYGNN